MQDMQTEALKEALKYLHRKNAPFVGLLMDRNILWIFRAENTGHFQKMLVFARYHCTKNSEFVVI